MPLIRAIESTVTDNSDITLIYLSKDVFSCSLWNKRLKYMSFILHSYTYPYHKVFLLITE